MNPRGLRLRCYCGVAAHCTAGAGFDAGSGSLPIAEAVVKQTHFPDTCCIVLYRVIVSMVV